MDSVVVVDSRDAIITFVVFYPHFPGSFCKIVFRYPKVSEQFAQQLLPFVCEGVSESGLHTFLNFQINKNMAVSFLHIALLPTKN